MNLGNLSIHLIKDTKDNLLQHHTHSKSMCNMRVLQLFILVAFLLLDRISAQAAASTSDELPITNTLVFIQSGEATESSINIMARCNNEVGSTMSLVISDNIGGGEDITQDVDVTSDTDFTNTFVVEGLSPDTSYTYVVKCIVGSEGISVYESTEGLFKTVPSADTVKAVSFVWVSCLSGQGYGRNPDFEITNADGETVKGEIRVIWYLFIFWCSVDLGIMLSIPCN